MFIREIYRLGYFDKVSLDGYLVPFFNNSGIEIKPDKSLVDAISDGTSPNQFISRLRVNIAGDSFIDDNTSELNRMRKHRERDLGLKRVPFGKVDRYYIGYIDIYIVKSIHNLPSNGGKNFDYTDILVLTTNAYERDILDKAIELQNKIGKECDNLEDCSIAIIDKVYVHPTFRRCKISTWIHNNISDIIHSFVMSNVSAVMLIAGDFANESNKMFNMTKEEYEQLLIKHYKEVGYKNFDHNIMYKRISKRKKILGII